MPVSVLPAFASMPVPQISNPRHDPLTLSPDNPQTLSHPILSPLARLVDYNAALATICFMLFLGFADDVLDIPWRVKLALPCVASLPLIIAYAGGTGVVVPRPLRALCFGLGPRLELGPLYYIYMVALVIFCANSINILAGVNGLEVGQTVVIASAVLSHNLMQLAGNIPDEGGNGKRHRVCGGGGGIHAQWSVYGGERYWICHGLCLVGQPGDISERLLRCSGQSLFRQPSQMAASSPTSHWRVRS